MGISSTEIFRNIARIKEFNRTKIDPLKDILPFTVQIIKYKMVKVVLYVVFLVFSAGATIGIVRLFYTFSGNEFVKYAPVIGLHIFVLINVGTIIIIGDEVVNMFNLVTSTMMPLEIFGEEHVQKICRRVKLMKAICYINTICAIFAALAFANSQAYLEERIYHFHLFKMHFPNIVPYYRLICCVTVFPIALLLVFSGHSMIYLIYSVILQLDILRISAKVSFSVELEENSRYDSPVYQILIRQRLKMIIMAHETIRRLTRENSAWVYSGILLNSIGVLILTGSLMMEGRYIYIYGRTWIKEGEHEYYETIAFILMTFCGTITTSIYLICGQSLKDKSEEVYNTICDLPWYSADSENRFLILMLMIHTAKPISISADLVEVNNYLAIRVGRGIYSIFCLIINFM